MRHLRRNIIITIVAFLLAFSVLPNNTEVQAATVTQTTQADANLNKWYNTCLTMGKNLYKYKFKYSNSRTKSTYRAALSSGRKSNCALYVSWCMQEYGALNKGQTFYVKGNGSIKKNFKSWGSKVQVIRVYKRCTSVSLRPGDIVCWSGSAHVCIYAGRNSRGDRLWFDGGKVATYGNRTNSRYKPFASRQLGYLNKRKISYVIRIKNIQ